MLANFLVPILDDGWRFIALFAGATFLAALTGAAWLFWPLFVADLVVDLFLPRSARGGVPQEDGLLIAPADGLVQMVVRSRSAGGAGPRRSAADARLDLPVRVFDVHINRAPCAATDRRRCLSAGQVPRTPTPTRRARRTSAWRWRCAVPTAA